MTNGFFTIVEGLVDQVVLGMSNGNVSAKWEVKSCTFELAGFESMKFTWVDEKY